MPLKHSAVAAAVALLAPVFAWGQPVPVASAQVSIVPAAGASDADDILAVERGVELVLCQAGVRPRVDGPEVPSELRLAATLTKADFEPDATGRAVSGRCEFRDAAAVLPGGARVVLPDMAITRHAPILRGRSAAETFFTSCGASFTRAALDALKDRVELRGKGCDAQPEAKKAPRRKPPR